MAISSIEKELEERLAELEGQGKLLEAQRLRMRTNYDLEMMKQVGFCSGIENYSRHIDGRGPGTAPATLIDYFPEDFLLVIDESHVTVPQIGGMYEGICRASATCRFRLPVALGHRQPAADLGGVRERIGQTVSCRPPRATTRWRRPAASRRTGHPPTGLVDPQVLVKPTKGRSTIVRRDPAAHERDVGVLVTTLTKKMAEDLNRLPLEWASGSGTCTPRSTRAPGGAAASAAPGEYDGWSASTAPQGLDLPVCRWWRSWTPKEGFLRRALPHPDHRPRRPQRSGRCTCTHKITDSMKEAIDETERPGKADRLQHRTRIDPQALRMMMPTS